MSVSYYNSLLSEVLLIRYKYHSFDGLQIRKVFYLSYINLRRQIIYRAIPTSQLANVVLVKRDFFLNNQPDTLIIQILFCYKTLHVSGIFSAHHQEFSTVHSVLVSFMQVSDDRFQAVIRNLRETYQCRMYSRKLLMMGREDAQNMQSFITE